MLAVEPPAARDGSSAAAVWPEGRQIGGFELKSVAMRGPSGLVYQAWDPALVRPLAIKEYLPAALARRDPSGEVHARGPASAEMFELGRCAFVDQARTLAQCEHPSLVRVLALLETDGTAYRVMPWYFGRTLLDVRRKMSGPIGGSALRALLDNLLGALDAFQRVGGVHRGISPAQLMLLDDGRAMLLGPRATGRAASVGSLDGHARIAEPGFAPPEQVDPDDGQPQGPWTDFYALAAVARFCITGEQPPADDADTGSLAALLAHRFPDLPSAHYDAHLLRALDAALSPEVTRRPQTAAQFREALLGVPHRSSTPSTPPVDAAVIKAAAAVAPIPIAADSIAELVEPVLAAEPHAMQPLHAEPEDWSGPGVRHRAPRRRAHPALWSGLALVAVAALVVGPWDLQALSSRFIGNEPPPTAAVQAPLTDSPSTQASLPVPAPLAALNPPPVAQPTTTRLTQLPKVATTAPEPASPIEPAPPVAAAREVASTNGSKTQPDQRESGASPVQDLSTSRSSASAEVSAAVPASNPRQECGARTEFSLYRCMQRQCSQAKWQQHPQCLHFAATDSVD